MGTTDISKQQLRQQMLARRATLDTTEVWQKSLAICAHLEAAAIFQTSHKLMLYVSLPQEVQTGPLLAEAQRQGKWVTVPVIVQRRLQAVLLPAPPHAWRPGRYGILEPVDTTNVVPPDELDGVFVPGVAFDLQGGRLGFGGGYYDTFLSALPKRVALCALAFALQLVPQVPMLSHDIRMPMVVTEQGIFSCDLPPHPLHTSGTALKEHRGV